MRSMLVVLALALLAFSPVLIQADSGDDTSAEPLTASLEVQDSSMDAAGELDFVKLAHSTPQCSEIDGTTCNPPQPNRPCEYGPCEFTTCICSQAQGNVWSCLY